MSGRWLWLAVLGSLLLGLAACASRVADGGTVALPRTGSDGSDARQRARLRLELAAGYLENGQAQVALDEIQRALLADPDFVPAHVLQGLAYMRLSSDRQAEDSFERALQIDPRDPDALHNHGWLLCQQGRHAQALDAFGRALAVPAYAGQAKTWMAQGICQLRMGQPAQAEASFLRSHALDAGHPVPAFNLAALLHRRGEDQRARSYIQRLNQSDLANAETLWLGVQVERRLRNTDAMDQLAQQLGRRYPQSPEWALYQRGAFDE
jgi:type IV pilus assembly protein PilF